MTRQEFSDQFDVLYNNITSNQAPGLDEYEKSIFLTKAQDEILKAYFNPKSNKTMDGFDGNEKRQIDFSMLMRTSVTNKNNDLNYFYNSGVLKDNFKSILDNKKNTIRIPIPSDVMIFINEFADVYRNQSSINGDTPTVRLVTMPLGYTDLNNLLSKPYKRPNHYQAWRIIDNVNSNTAMEIIIGPNDRLAKYTIRYVKKPYPIILETLSDNLSINGETEPWSSSLTKNVFTKISNSNNYSMKEVNTNQACELDPILHEEILQRAVELAKAAYTGGLQEQLILGNASQTSVGFAGRGGMSSRGEQ